MAGWSPKEGLCSGNEALLIPELRNEGFSVRRFLVPGVLSTACDARRGGVYSESFSSAVLHYFTLVTAAGARSTASRTSSGICDSASLVFAGSTVPRFYLTGHPELASCGRGLLGVVLGRGLLLGQGRTTRRASSPMRDRHRPSLPPQTRKEQVQRALRRWPESLRFAVERVG